MTWRIDDPQGMEARKVMWDIVPYTRGRVLDLGCGNFKTFPHFIGVDNGHHWGKADADLLVNTCERLEMIASGSCDAVFSSHLLEHIKFENVPATLREWWRVIKQGGHLILYVPDEDEYPKVGEEGANPDHKWNVNYQRVIEAMEPIGGWDLVEYQKRNGGQEYSLFFVFKKTNGKVRHSWRNPKPAKTCAVVRYGAFGDAIQASSILPALKAEGYHVTFYTNALAYEILKLDPNIDRFIIQDKDQVPNHMLADFWRNEAKKYDKWINLSGSIEGTLLPGPDSDAHKWPWAVRHKYLNRNYLEWTHELAEVPFEPRQAFYPTTEERAWARKQREKMGGRVILWSLAGSSVHKSWPHLDTIIARIMLYMPDTKVVLVGDEVCQILEVGWEDEPRVIRRSGVWSIRESMAFCEVADLVIGTETGLLNCAGMLETPKIVTLSHSSVENLSKHWKNTISMTPGKHVHCYPCHRLHLAGSGADGSVISAWEHCWRHEESGTAMCQHEIGPEEMWAAIKRVMERTCQVQAA